MCEIFLQSNLSYNSSSLSEKINLLLTLVHVSDQVQHTVGVSSFIVIPRHKLDKVIRQSNTCLLVKDGRMCVTDKVTRHNILLLVSQNTRHTCLAGFLKFGANGGVRSTLVQTCRQVYNRHVGSRNTKSLFQQPWLLPWRMG